MSQKKVHRERFKPWLCHEILLLLLLDLRPLSGVVLVCAGQDQNLQVCLVAFNKWIDPKRRAFHLYWFFLILCTHIDNGFTFYFPAPHSFTEDVPLNFKALGGCNFNMFWSVVWIRADSRPSALTFTKGDHSKLIRSSYPTGWKCADFNRSRARSSEDGLFVV